jgi:sodium transport system permease protein
MEKVMNKQILTVMLKEIKDNFRDRKTLMSSIFMGAIFMPVLFVGLMNFMVNMAKDKQESELTVAIQGIENADSFIAFLHSNGIKTEAFSGDAKTAIEDKSKEAVLIIPETFAEDFTNGTPAKVELYYDKTAKGVTNVTIDRIRSTVQQYSRTIAMTRLQLRGVNPSLLQAVYVEDHDVSTAQSQGARIMSFLPYVLILGLFIGSMYLAIDTMAGEKERNSLEALLLNPIKRSHLLIGKLMATMTFGFVTLIATLISLKIALPFLPLEKLGMAVDLGPKNIAILLAVLAPLSILAASLQTIIATYAKSFKEAQTYVNLLMFIPMLPSMALMMLPVKEELWMMATPILGQNLVINQIMRGESVSSLSIVLVAIGSLLVGLLLALLAIKLYNRENLLFSK